MYLTHENDDHCDDDDIDDDDDDDNNGVQYWVKRLPSNNFNKYNFSSL